MRQRPLNTFLLALVISLSICVVLVATLPPPPITKEQNEHAQKHPEEAAKQNSPLRRFWNWTTHDPVAFYTSVLALFTGILGGSTILLWLDTRNAARRQAADTEILQRAYISVEPGGILASHSIGKCHPNIIIKNVGHLPARNTCWFIDYAIDQDHRRSAFALDLTKLEGEVTLTPGMQMQQGGPIIYVGDEPGDLKEQIGLYLYVWGLVRYDNGFGESRRTQFCHRYNAVNLERLYHERKRSDGTIEAGLIYGHRIDVEDARVHRYGNDAT